MTRKTGGRQAGKKTSSTTGIVIGVLILVAAAAATTWLQGSRVAAYPADISVAEAAAKRSSGAFILDVRQPEEWAEVHIPGTTLIPLGELASRVNEVPRDKDVVVVCRSGNRSQEGRDILRRAGLQKVASMDGGMREWAAAGHPTVSGP
jgi:rhodanese-related sulfurtransferase